MASPNSNEVEDIAQWITFYDIYQSNVFPHLLEFDSWTDAVRIVRSIDLASVSQKMREHNIKEFHRIGRLWAKMFDRIRKRKPESGQYPERIDTALQKYGLAPLGQDAGLQCRFKRKPVTRDPVIFDQVDYNPGSKCTSSLTSTSEQSRNVQHIKNLLVQGSYLEVCKQPKFDPEQNLLSCTIADKLLKLSDPFACVEDIHVTPDVTLSC